MEFSQELWTGLELMLLGMATVFLFLSLLVLTMKLLSKTLTSQNAPSPAPQHVAGSATMVNNETTDNNDEIAAVVAAVHKHRNQSR